MKDLIERIESMMKYNKVTDFTLEPGHGETYDHGGAPVLYGHGEYPRSSVLYGQTSRHFIESWETWEEARDAMIAVKAALGRKFIYGETNSTSHIPVDQMTRHLPDEDGNTG